MQQVIEFKSAGETIRGWLFTPDGATGPFPTIIMAGGWCYVKELVQPDYAKTFADAGLAAILFDYRNFGASDGERRQHIDPNAQIEDYKNAISFAETLDQVDSARIGVWGLSYSGGHALIVGATDPRGYRLEVNEFDYKGENHAIYEENGVVIRAFPAIHGVDGAVSFALEWNGLKFVFGSDTFPNKWFVKYAKDADIAIHECFIAVPDIVNRMGFTPESALYVGTQIHTAPEAFGKVMSEVKPRMAVAYHFFNDFDTLPGVIQQVRMTYDGPVSFSTDYMVWNVTKDDIRVRMAVVDEAVWPLPSVTEKLPADPADQYGFSDFINSGRVVYKDVIEKIYRSTNEQFGTDIPAPN